jgi:hypothetical protein
MMAKSGPKAIREITEAVYKQFGMRIVVLGAYVDADGDLSTSL